MENLQVTVLGRDNEQPKEVFVRSFDSVHIALGMSVGVLSKANEDALGVATLGVEAMLVLADGHWGREASELAVTQAVELLGPEIRPAKDSETRARLFALHEQINTELYERAMAAPGASSSETTLIACHIKAAAEAKYLYWSSFGDSFLYLLRNGALKQLNTLNARWLGYLSKLSERSETRSILMRFISDEARYVGVASGLETGIEKLEAGDLIFLCSDGLMGSDTQPDHSTLEAVTAILKADRPLIAKAESLIHAAIDRGEEDNVSCVLAHVV